MKRAKKSYNSSDLMNALQDVKDGKFNITTAAKIHNVPRQTLADKVKGKSPAIFCRPGPHPLLGVEVEDKLKNWALQNTESGFITTKDSVLFSVHRIIEQNFEPSVQQYFKTRSLGSGWYKAFKKRYPEVVLKKLETCFSYTPVTKTELRVWFRKVRKQLGKNAEILIDPERIFCMGELILALNPPLRRNNYLFSEKETVMVLFASNAEAKFAPPMINFKYNSATCSPVTNTNEYQVTYTTTGKMNCQTFYDYFVQSFYPYLLRCKVEFPVVLFLDARIAHTSLALAEFCQENGILLVSLLPNAINVIHPFESGFFQLFKEMWKTEVKFWPARNNNVSIKEENVDSVISNIMQFTEFAHTMQKAFRKCGLFPFDVNAIDYSTDKKLEPQPQVLQNTTNASSHTLQSNNLSPKKIETNKRKYDEISESSSIDATVEKYIIEDYIVEVQESIDEDKIDDSDNAQLPHPQPDESTDRNDAKRKKLEVVLNMAENNELDLNINAEDIVATQDDNQDVLRKKNKDLQSLLEKVIDLLKEKTNVCLNLEKQNSALNLQISSLKDIVSITKNLLSIRNMEVENMQKDMTSLQDKINAEKERHNKMIETVSSANKLNEDIKGEYQNQMSLFQQLREKYNEKVSLLAQENEKLKAELQTFKVPAEEEKNESQ